MPAENYFTVKVTQEHIDKATKLLQADDNVAWQRACPISHALREYFQCTTLEVYAGHVRIFDTNWSGPPRVYYTTQETRDYIKATDEHYHYDRGEKAQPQEVDFFNTSLTRE